MASVEDRNDPETPNMRILTNDPRGVAKSRSAERCDFSTCGHVTAARLRSDLFNECSIATARLAVTCHRGRGYTPTFRPRAVRLFSGLPNS